MGNAEHKIIEYQTECLRTTSGLPSVLLCGGASGGITSNGVLWVIDRLWF